MHLAVSLHVRFLNIVFLHSWLYVYTVFCKFASRNIFDMYEEIVWQTKVYNCCCDFFVRLFTDAVFYSFVEKVCSVVCNFVYRSSMFPTCL